MFASVLGNSSKNRRFCPWVRRTVSLGRDSRGELQKGEPLRVDPFLDEGAILWKGVEAARLLLAELFELAVQHSGRPQQ
ncbi:hypothetical protein EAS62_29305 [Bradyrhizobium zhanjiangense]|uniref:Uncharacterized protein n=1 Tax=Bradyrhizobium zhanjiangense TaxID=1325107 RepID=A0ABY0DDT4_9BRAD|nr:hypothetical protein EAS62_29305 [Bradyrhizobium zhanjiangense]